jgi:ethanolamine transporter
MLAGGYPFIFLLRTYLSKPIAFVGAKIRLGALGTLGLLASLTNVIVMFLLVKDMDPRDKVINVAFAVCGAFLIGDHLAFNLNVQPSITVALLCGKLVGGMR